SINGDDADERDVREVVAFGEHLCADEHIKFARAEFQNCALEKFAARGRVAVKTCDAKRWKTLLQHLFELFRSFADVVNIFSVARRAARGRRLTMIGVTTDDAQRAAMMRE